MADRVSPRVKTGTDEFRTVAEEFGGGPPNSPHSPNRDACDVLRLVFDKFRLIIDLNRYLLYSGERHRLCFLVLGVGMEDLAQGHGIDRHRLLGESIEKLAATF